MSLKKKLYIPSSVLVNETFEKYEYDITSLYGSENNQLKVLFKCSKCSNIGESKLSSVIGREKKNIKCYNCPIVIPKERTMRQVKTYKDNLRNGITKPSMLGKNHTEETKKKLSDFRKGKSFEELYGKERADELKAALRIYTSGSNNGFYGKTHSPEFCKAQSDRQKKNVKRGSESNFYGKHYFPKRGPKFLYNGIRFRSVWESKVAKYLDDNGILWSFEKLTFKLSNTTYTPDFYLIDLNIYIEVKGYWYEDAIEKFKLFKKEYPNVIVEIWDEQKLKDLHII